MYQSSALKARAVKLIEDRAGKVEGGGGQREGKQKEMNRKVQHADQLRPNVSDVTVVRGETPSFITSTVHLRERFQFFNFEKYYTSNVQSFRKNIHACIRSF